MSKTETAFRLLAEGDDSVVERVLPIFDYGYAHPVFEARREFKRRLRRASEVALDIVGEGGK